MGCSRRSTTSYNVYSDGELLTTTSNLEIDLYEDYNYVKMHGKAESDCTLNSTVSLGEVGWYDSDGNGVYSDKLLGDIEYINFINIYELYKSGYFDAASYLFFNHPAYVYTNYLLRIPKNLCTQYPFDKRAKTLRTTKRYR